MMVEIESLDVRVFRESIEKAVLHALAKGDLNEAGGPGQ